MVEVTDREIFLSRGFLLSKLHEAYAIQCADSLEKYVDLMLKEHDIEEVYTNGHHILPKSKFPEYADFKRTPDNKLVLPFQDHVVAHFWLAKATGLASLWSAVSRLLGKKLPESVAFEELVSLQLQEIGEAARKGISEAKKGSKASEETKRRMSASQRARIRSEEEIERIREQVRERFAGRKLTEEHKAKLSKAHKGMVVSEETRKKIAAAATGKKPSAETRLKQSRNNAMHSAENRLAVKRGLRKGGVWGHYFLLFDMWLEYGKPKAGRFSKIVRENFKDLGNHNKFSNLLRIFEEEGRNPVHLED